MCMKHSCKVVRIGILPRIVERVGLKSVESDHIGSCDPTNID